VLGLLAGRPMSGYDLIATVEQSVGRFWSVSRAGIYRELSRLEDGDLVTGTEVAQDRRPDKRTYEPTPDGRDAFRAWLDTTRVEDEGRKIGFLVKFFFARDMPPGQVEGLLAEVATSTQRDLDTLTAINDRLLGGSLTHERLTARHGILVKQARLEWIAEARRELGLDTDTRP